MKFLVFPSRTHSASTELHVLVEGVRNECPKAEQALLDLVLLRSQPYFSGYDYPERIASICDTAWLAIQEGALLRPEALPSFIETLAWRELKYADANAPLSRVQELKLVKPIQQAVG